MTTPLSDEAIDSDGENEAVNKSKDTKADENDVEWKHGVVVADLKSATFAVAVHCYGVYYY